jgi:hypothetical protein
MARRVCLSAWALLIQIKPNRKPHDPECLWRMNVVKNRRTRWCFNSIGRSASLSNTWDVVIRILLNAYY